MASEGKNHTTPWLHQWQCHLVEPYRAWILWMASWLHCQCQSKSRVVGGRVSLPPLDSLKSSLDMKLQTSDSYIMSWVRLVFWNLQGTSYKVRSQTLVHHKIAIRGVTYQITQKSMSGVTVNLNEIFLKIFVTFYGSWRRSLETETFEKHFYTSQYTAMWCDLIER